jgi:hypothetical protein
MESVSLAQIHPPSDDGWRRTKWMQILGSHRGHAVDGCDRTPSKSIHHLPMAATEKMDANSW